MISKIELNKMISWVPQPIKKVDKGNLTKKQNKTKKKNLKFQFNQSSHEEVNNIESWLWRNNCTNPSKEGWTLNFNS
jgi:hypothetical protein